ncbi:hypothetical protein BDC45DRAFT_450041 [Circinella umbellata]|nr:hypothetical protein BDC45DRAFT_450041 [Circinella umbellata]
MSIQQGLKDGRYRYNADGILRTNDFSNLEMMLTEVSCGYGKTENGKASFDHYKGMFGLLAMLKMFAEKYKEASFKTFRKLKVHFVHGHGNYSMSIQGKGVFVMNKEQRVKVPVEFSSKDIELVPFVNFYVILASAFDETLDVVEALKTEHKDAMRKLSAASLNKEKRNKHTNLLNVVDPIIIRLNEGKHASVVAEHGPSSPDHSY